MSFLKTILEAWIRTASIMEVFDVAIETAARNGWREKARLWRNMKGQLQDIFAEHG